MSYSRRWGLDIGQDVVRAGLRNPSNYQHHPVPTGYHREQQRESAEVATIVFIIATRYRSVPFVSRNVQRMG